MVRVGQRSPDPVDDVLRHRLEQGLLAAEVPVQPPCLNIQTPSELAHRQAVEPVGVQERERAGEHIPASQLHPPILAHRTPRC